MPLKNKRTKPRRYIEAGLSKGAEEGLATEQACFAKAVSSLACRGLVHFFFASRNTAAVPGVTDVGLKPRPTKCVGVIGGGLMGSGIATACILNGGAGLHSLTPRSTLDSPVYMWSQVIEPMSDCRIKCTECSDVRFTTSE